MSNVVSKRILSEVRELMVTSVAIGNTADDSGVSVQPITENMQQLEAIIVGPDDTPYEGGIFRLNVKFPANYPFNPPEVVFTTPIWHPNISSVTGVICLDILKSKWAAALTLRTVLISIRVLLSEPVPEDPQDAVVAKQFMDKKDLFSLTANIWTHIFADGKVVDQSGYQAAKSKVESLVDMGIAKEKAIRFLSYANWDINAAIEKAYD